MHACVDEFIKDNCVAGAWDGRVDGDVGFISSANYQGGLCIMEFRIFLLNLLNIILISCRMQSWDAKQAFRKTPCAFVQWILGRGDC